MGAAKSVDDAKSKRVVRATSPSAPAATAVAKPSKLTPLDDPRLAQDDFRAALEQATADIGWTQRGGQLIRSGVAEAGDGDGDGGRAGAVVGRTQWLGPDLWRERPDGISEDDAKAAIRNALAGKPMTARQKRFVQYVLDRAAERVQADRDNAAENIAEDAAERAAIMAETGAGPAGMASIESEDWLDIASTDKRAGMRALGFTEKEIEDALGPEDQAQGSDEGQVARAVEERPGEGAEAGAARAEEEGGREEGLTAPQVEPAASEERAQTSVKPREKTPAEARVVALRKRVSVLESLRACLNG